VYRGLLLPQQNSIRCRSRAFVQKFADRVGRTQSPVDYYFQRFGFCGRQIECAPSPNLGLVVVIPCYAEPDLIGALEALWRCERPQCAVEVITIINSAEDAIPSVHALNRDTAEKARAWTLAHADDGLRFFCLNFEDLPAKTAGVGLARKIGMDEALRRLSDVGRIEGAIVCFDADCTCDPNYLIEIERFFATRPQAPGCSIYFEHPLDGSEEARIYEAITRYELHLRYYIEGLRYAGFPYAFHTIGSSMAVRARVYAAQGGMNKRQAGEDFYFLHKVIPLGGFGEINGTRVLASPRPSDRVPFGTGRAVREYLNSGRFESYPLQAFDDLRFLFADVSMLYQSDEALGGCSEVLRDFLKWQKVESHLKLIREHTASPAAFQKRFFHWFDGFMAMKYIHFARDRAYGSGDIENVAGAMYRRRIRALFAPTTTHELLGACRELQRGTFAAT
jgi:hypothetical protein